MRHRRHEGSVRLEFAIDVEIGAEFLGAFKSRAHFVHIFVLRRTIGGERKHSHLGFDASHRARSVGRANGNLCQLLSIGHWRHRHVAHHDDTVCAIFVRLRQEQHRTTHHRDTRSGFDDLEGRTKHIASGVARTSQLSVSIASLDDQATEIEGIFHDGACRVDGHSLLRTELCQELCIFLLLLVRERIDDGGFLNVGKTILLSECLDFGRVANEYEVGHLVSEDAVGCFECAFFRAFGENDALLVGFCASNELFDKCHY